MKITFLGTGPSPGVPSPCCDCEVCLSDDPRNKRLRTSILAQNDGYNLLVDTSIDLRQQSLTHKITRIDAVLYTHHHADHILGMEELRCFNYFNNNMVIPCYGREATFVKIRETFRYVFDANPSYNGWVAKVELHPVDTKPFTLGGMLITPVEIMHGDMTILAYKFNDSAYVTDCSAIPDASADKLKNLDLLILNALRHDPHPNHINLSAALGLVEKLQPRRALLTHMNHQIDYRRVSKDLPEGVKLAYDGLSVEV